VWALAQNCGDGHRSVVTLERVLKLTLFYTGYFFALFYTGGGLFAPLCNFLRRSCRTKIFRWGCRSDPNFFLIINWGDDVMPQGDDVTFLVKNDFFTFAQIRSIVYIFTFKG